MQSGINFGSKVFAKRFHYDGDDLGARLTENGTVFKLWAPTAEGVVLRLYPSGHTGEAVRTVSMQREEKGVWSWQTDENLDGVYYDYEVTVGRDSHCTADPYARACGMNGWRSMVVDLPKTNPKDWEHDRAPERQAEDIIYEVHVREFSWAESGGFPEKVRGKYKAFCETDTTLFDRGEQPTGLAYLRDLGVTHVQLMPVYDYGSVNEARPDDSFNWGYDPVNYNVPEGSYSSDPTKGEVRIRELKELVQSLHQQGFRVIMDVVYNHTYSRDSWLERTAPGYYYRTWQDGTPCNGSGCGNDLASERSMCAKYILESVLYWAEEYHMDGFRFDLMGLLDAALMERIRAELDARYGRGEKLVFGEPWAAGETACKRGIHLANQKYLRKMDLEIGAFADKVRDTIKGSVMDAAKVGFVNGARGQEHKIIQSVTAWCEKGFRAPAQSITYVSSHDDMTLWDKLVYTLDPKCQYDVFTPEVLRANRLAAAIYMTCQGRLFLLSGEEFGRTKQGAHNTYNAPIALNRLDWERAWDNHTLVDYYRGLIALRKQLPALCDKGEDAWQRMLHAEVLTSRCVSITLDNTGGTWETIKVIYNASSHAVPLGGMGWELLADGRSSFLWQTPQPIHQPAVQPVSVLILGKRGE